MALTVLTWSRPRRGEDNADLTPLGFDTPQPRNIICTEYLLLRHDAHEMEQRTWIGIDICHLLPKVGGNALQLFFFLVLGCKVLVERQVSFKEWFE